MQVKVGAFIGARPSLCEASLATLVLLEELNYDFSTCSEHEVVIVSSFRPGLCHER